MKEGRQEEGGKKRMKEGEEVGEGGERGAALGVWREGGTEGRGISRVVFC